ncbi:YjeJ family protein [Leclercia adecarboxylata]|uniref:YjeJ family protein n=1 Tax=Enterobacteriaceae TaxID=543 RepID=UPI001106DB1D|nr:MULTISPECIES: YjeJ family protein [Enterobacteriaceae]QCZ27582.1 hypothetical protein FHN83_13470 [Leclercia adecarboxylata]TLU67871.1 hypothetical protein FFB58_12755 [Enterobacter sp. MF024]
MQEKFIGFNTASITHAGNFLALMLKIKLNNQFCQTYYLQANILSDLLLILQSRLQIIIQRLEHKGDDYKSELITYNEDFVTHTPLIDMSEIEQPNPAQRIMSITLKPAETWCTIILVLQNEEVVSLRIDDMQVEALLVGIRQALENSEDNNIIKYLSSNLEFLMLYAVDLTKVPNIDYQQYTQDSWKLNLFTHYLGVLFCCETTAGKKIISGAVIKTSAPHLSETENSIVMSLIDKSPKLKSMHNDAEPCQIFSRIISSHSGKMLTLEECLRPLHAFYLETQATLNS